MSNGIPAPDADGAIKIETPSGGRVLVPGAVLVSPVTGFPVLGTADGTPAVESLTSTGAPGGTIPVAAASPIDTKRSLSNALQTVILIKSVTLTIKCATLDLDGFGGEAAPLTNGITIRVMNGTTPVLSPLTAVPIRTTAQLLTLAPDAFVVEAGSQTILTATWDLPQLLFITPGNKIEMNVGDSLAATEVQAAISAWLLQSQ